MTRRGYLLAAVILALAVGYLAGHRVRITVRRFVPVPPDPAWRDCYLDDMAGLA